MESVAKTNSQRSITMYYVYTSYNTLVDVVDINHVNLIVRKGGIFIGIKLCTSVHVFRLIDISVQQFPHPSTRVPPCNMTLAIKLNVDFG